MGPGKGTDINRGKPKGDKEGKRGATWLETTRQEKTRRQEKRSTVHSCGMRRSTVSCISVVSAATRAAAIINFFTITVWIFDFGSFPSFRSHRNSYFPHQKGPDPEISSRGLASRSLPLWWTLGVLVAVGAAAAPPKPGFPSISTHPESHGDAPQVGAHGGRPSAAVAAPAAPRLSRRCSPSDCRCRCCC